MNNDAEEESAQEYFKKIQGEGRSDAKPERTSSITPEEFRRREFEHKEYLKNEEYKIKKTNEIMKVSFYYFSIGVLGLIIAFLGIAWVFPYVCLKVHQIVMQAVILIPLILIGAGGIFCTIFGIAKFFGTQKKVEGSPDW